MVLQYKFEYTSNNNTLTNFLLRIGHASDVAFEITRNADEICLYAQGEQDALETFSQDLSQNLPMSIFLKNTSVDVVENMPDSGISKEIKHEAQLPFCPQCLAQAENENSNHYYNPFTQCDFCTSAQDISQFMLTINGQKEISNQYQTLLNQVATQLNKGSKVQIKTFSGTYIFEKLENIASEEQTTSPELLCTDLMNIAKVFVASKSEIVALASLEKPRMSLKVNEIFKHKNILKTSHANVRFASDLVLYFLSKEVAKLGIDFLHITQDSEYDVSLEPDTQNFLPTIFVPTIQITQDDRVIMLQNNNYDDKLTQIYNKFEDKNKGQFMVLLQENDLFKKSIINFYVSTCANDNIALYTNELGSFLDVLNYTLPSSIEALFEEIKKDETGERLIANFQKTYPETFQKAINYDISGLNKQSIVSFWEIAQIVLGFDETVLNSAMACLLEKGPRIDYKLVEQEKIYNQTFNFAKLIKSGMSFKLAGVEQNTIALGYIESYAHFISNVVDEVNNEIDLDGISLCGDIFSNHLICNFVHKSITKNYKIYYNKDFVIQAS